MNFPFVFSNIPAAPTYGVYISQMIRYSKASSSYQDVFDIGLLLRMKLLNQGFLLVRLKSSLRKCYGRHHAFADRYGLFLSQMTTICSTFRHTSRAFPHSRLITEFVTRLTRRLLLVQQELPTLPEHPRFLVGFVFIDL